MPTFRVGVTRDLRGSDGKPVHDLGMDLLSVEARVEWEFLPVHERELSPSTIAGYDALMIWEPGGVSAASLAEAGRLVLLARFGMGLEAIDLDACSARGVLVTTAPDAVREIMPAGAMTFLLALAHRLPQKDRSVRAGRWSDREDLIGTGTSGRTVGVIGFGNIGRGVIRMAEPFGLRRIVADPYVAPASLPPDVELVDLPTLLRTADFVCVTCPLTAQTHHLLSAERLSLMRRGTYVINIARGPLVDTLALAEAVRSGHLAGAGLDVFESEPIEPDHPLLKLDNVILSPHAIGYTEAAFRGIGTTACRSVLAVARGERPPHIANPAALSHARHERWRALSS
jgi:D-3-phosphoglycerate dehydrogenase